MSELNMTISLAPEDRARIDALIAAVTASISASSPIDAPAAPAVPATTKPAAKSAAKPAAAKPAAKPEPEPAPEPEAIEEDDDDFGEEDAGGEEVTREMILAHLKKVSAVHGKPAAIDILKKVGNAAALTALADDKFQAVYAALSAKLED
jgi:hypothetical protein